VEEAVAELFARVTPDDKECWKDEIRDLKQLINPDDKAKFREAVMLEKKKCFIHTFFLNNL
jgi:hypothetical protein